MMMMNVLVIIACLVTTAWSFQPTARNRSIVTTTASSSRLFQAADKWSQRPAEGTTVGAGRMERIEYKIYPDGRVEEKVFGIKGSDCHKITENIEKALGVVVHTAPTEEMFEEKIVQNSVIQVSADGGWEGTSTW
jgi:Protein of unknown function (DUF2997)